VTVTGLNAVGVQANSGGSITGSNTALSVTSTGTTDTVFGAFATGTGAVVTLTGGSVQVTDGNSSGGLHADVGGTINGTDLAVSATVTLGGTETYAVNANGGTINLTGGSVQGGGATGVNYGLYVDNGGTLTTRNVAVAMSNGDNVNGVQAFSGTITMTGGSVRADGTTTAYGLNSQSGTTITGTNVAVTASSSGGFACGADASGTGAVIQLNGGSVTASGSNANGFLADSGGAITATNVAVTSSLIGAYVSGGSSLTLTGGSLTGSGGNAIFTTGGTAGTPNTIVVNGGTLNSPASDLISANNAVSNVTLNGVTSAASGSNRLLGVFNTSTVTFTADRASRLTGDIVSDASSTANINILNDSVLTGAINGAQAHVLIDPSTWNVTGDSSVATLNNSGIIAFSPSGPFKTVTVTGAYTGGGSILFNTTLNNGAVQLSDKLVAGSTTGTTTVFINNKGGSGGLTGSGATDGIQVVSVTGGAAASNGTFVLGQRVAAGLHDYNLVRADGQNWYLQSEAAISPEIPNIATFNSLGLLTGKAQVDTLQARLGEFHRPDASPSGHTSEIWNRSFYHEDNLHTGDFGAAQVDISGTQLGGDLRCRDVFAPDDRLYVGGFAEYAHAAGRPTVGTTSLDSYGAGLYATYYHGDWYVDALFKGDANQYQANVPGDPGMSTSGYGLSPSLEGGRQFALGQGWAVEPQAQATYQYEEIGAMNDFLGRTYRFDDPQSLDLRLGVKLEKSFSLSNGSQITPYLRVSGIQDLLGTNRLTVDSTTVNTPYGGTSAMFDGGVTARVTEKVDLYASGIVVAGNRQDSTGLSAGVRIAW